MAVVALKRVGFDQKYFEKNYPGVENTYYFRMAYGSAIKYASKQVDILNGFGKRAPDVGCGYGYVVEMLQRMNYEAYALDTSSYALRMAKEKVKAYFIANDGERLCFQNETFDLVTSFEALEPLKEPAIAIEL